jgi:uncharacterized membrane protein YphA (DoxX/SURF4 family)
MKNNPGFQRIDKTLTRWMQTYGILFLRISIGIVFLWFGVLKFFPGLSPGEDLAIQTMKKLSFGLIPGNILIVWQYWKPSSALALFFASS